MSSSDIISIFQWWSVFFILGLIFLPLTTYIFQSFFDRGYLFSKIIAVLVISYILFLFGVLKLISFNVSSIYLLLVIFALLNGLLFFKLRTLMQKQFKALWFVFLFEELLFLLSLFFWSYIRAHQPEIHGLEKYMDFGFVNSILRSEYFPPKDMWFPPFSINYYYFGHLFTAVLTKLSGIPSFSTYNLMIATIFSFTFSCSFSIGTNLLYQNFIRQLGGSNFKLKNILFKLILGGLLTAFLVSFAGNLHTIYTFFKPYQNESPLPLWQLAFSPLTFPNSYWYPNATRFIQNTIHEFPIYSFVVSDLHGHVLSIPIVLTIIALLLSLILNSKFSILNQIKNYKNSNSFQISSIRETQDKNFKFQIVLLGFLLATAYMTNAWDGIIYFLLTALVLLYLNLKILPSEHSESKAQNSKLKTQNYSLKLKVLNFELQFYALRFTLYALAIGVGFFIFTLPFSLNFKPFVSGIGVLCAPDFLTKIGKLGPFLFEKDHCQHSPWWQILTLYGFFYFWVTSFFVFLFNKMSVIKNEKLKIQNNNSKFKNLNSKLKLLTFNFELLTRSDLFILILITLSTLLIIIPEFIYIKDIYPAHYRANTMFKLVYQSFIMLSICSGYIIIRLISNLKYQISKLFIVKFIFLIFAILFFILVSIYPQFAINSYYGELKIYYGLDGLKYLKNLYPTDYEAIIWLDKNIKGQPVILEAQGDSYTDYARVSSNTGLPTVLGWTVHEWLWRGTYDIPSPRIAEVQTMYESEDMNQTTELIKKHSVELVFIGDLERQKYPNLNEEKFEKLGKIIYQNGNTKIYRLDI